MTKLLVSKRFQIGFTLIELLIAVALISVLFVVGAVSYTTAARNARDAQRKSDLKKIQLALEEFYADHGAYPAEHGAVPDEISCITDGNPVLPTAGFSAGATFRCGSNTYLQSMPGDPKTGLGYYYEIGDGMCEPVGPDSDFLHCQKYTLWARLENTNDPAVTQTNNDSFCQSYLYSGLTNYGANYCVHQPNR